MKKDLLVICYKDITANIQRLTSEEQDKMINNYGDMLQLVAFQVEIGNDKMSLHEINVDDL